MLHRPSSERPLPVPAGQQLDAKQQQQVRTLLRIMRHGSAVGNGTAKGALLASEPGTGKTPMSITVANALGGNRPFRVLIIVGQNYRHVWLNHILRWQSPARHIISVEAGDVYDLSLQPNCWVIINYEILDRFEASIRRKEWDLLILDEAHAAKNALAKRTVQIYGGKWERQRIKPIPAVKTLIVTGSPILNYPYELYTALRHLDPEQWSRRYKAFVHEWYDPESAFPITIDETLRVVAVPRNLDQLQAKLRSTVMVREYLDGLKPKIYEVKPIPPKPEDIDFFMGRTRALKQLQKKLRLTKKKSERAEIRELLNQSYATARRRTANRKYVHVRDALLAQSDKLLLSYEGQSPVLATRKTLVFALHDHIVQRLADDLRRAGKKVVTLTGKTRYPRVAMDRLQNDPDCQFFIGNIRAAGVGIDLYAATHVVFAELDWVPGLMEQAENRAHRRGQTQQVIVTRFYMECSSDEWIWQALHSKKSINRQALDPAPYPENPYPEVKMTPEMQEAFWQAFEKTFEQTYGEPFEDAFHDVGDEKEDDNVHDKNQHASFNVDEWIATLLEQPDEVETKDRPISGKRCARLRKLTEDEPQKCKEWSTICPAVKNYIPHYEWMVDENCRTVCDELGNRIPNEETVLWNRIVTMRWKAEQSDHAPEVKVSWNFYKECLGRAKTKYGYIAPIVIEKFPDLGLETFD